MNHFIPALFFMHAQHERYGNMHGDDVVLQPSVTLNNVRRIEIKPAELVCNTMNGDLDYTHSEDDVDYYMHRGMFDPT